MSSLIKDLRRLFNAHVTSGSGTGAAVWGAITGVLSSQTDLQSALDAKLSKNSTITGSTNTKITYDSNGLVTSSTNATTADISDITDKRYITDSELVIINNTTNTNTGDETKTTIVSKLLLISGFININFGTGNTDLIVTTVSNINVLSTTKFICIVENDGVDHTGEDTQIENILANIINIIPNTSFDIIAVAHNLTWGRYKITYKEII